MITPLMPINAIYLYVKHKMSYPFLVQHKMIIFASCPAVEVSTQCSLSDYWDSRVSGCVACLV